MIDSFLSKFAVVHPVFIILLYGNGCVNIEIALIVKQVENLAEMG